MCNRDCDPEVPSNYRPDLVHLPNCPVWRTLYHYEHDTVNDILSEA